MSADRRPGAVVGPKGWAVRPFKQIRELGRSVGGPVRSLSVAGVGKFEDLSRGPGWTYRWCTSCSAGAPLGEWTEINAESI